MRNAPSFDRPRDYAARALASGALAVQELVLARLVPRGRVTRAASGAAVAALAYIVDYHLIPRRLTPGWELRLSRRSVALGFVALGAGLGVAQLVRRD